MTLITDTEALAELCRRLAKAEFVTVDTEFLRDRTYWPRLCLVQLAGPDEAAAVDALAPGIDLDPLYALLANRRVLKVFHAARQDIEIFLHQSGKVPVPLFDTQVAAMVCGFGDAVSYEALAGRLAKAEIDKSMRFTDWSRRPLSKRQLDYALSDVTHLRVIYERLAERLAESGRADWVADEMAVLTNPATYRLDPDEAWRRIKTRLKKPRHLAILRMLAAWREREAQRRDLPRSRVLRDETLVEVAAQEPATRDELRQLRSGGRELANKDTAEAVLAVAAEAAALPRDKLPKSVVEADRPARNGATVELLKVLLKARCEDHRVAQRLVATSEDIEIIARDDQADVAALKGWRREVFGEDALRLKHGRLALTSEDGRIKTVPLDGAAARRAQA